MLKISHAKTGITIAILAMLTAGCTKTLKKESVENVIKTSYEKAGLKIKSATCPSREVKAGDTFECTAEIEGGSKATFTVTQKDAKGNLGIDVLGIHITDDKVSAALSKEAGAKVEAKCTTKVTFLRKGDTYACDFTTADGAGKVTYATKDDKTAEATITFAGKPPKVEPVDPAGTDMPAETAAAEEE